MLFDNHRMNWATGLNKLAKNWKGKINTFRIPAGLIRKRALGKNSAKIKTMIVEINVTISSVEIALIPVKYVGIQWLRMIRSISMP